MDNANLMVPEAGYPREDSYQGRRDFDNDSLYSVTTFQTIMDEKEDAKVENDKLPPRDGGKGAWTVLLAGFLLEAVLAGRMNL